MRKPIVFLALIGVCCLIAALMSYDGKCSNLVLEVNVTKAAGAIAYATLYDCTVTDVRKGRLKDGNTHITVLAGNHKLDSLFSACAGTPKRIEIGFVRHKRNEQYRNAYVDGFVDQGMTSWKIQYTKPKAK